MTTIEELQRLSDDQLIEKVAVEVMGAFRNARNGRLTMGSVPAPPHGCDNNAPRWNPLTDWNHTMEVVERFLPHFRIECCGESDYAQDKDAGEWHCDIWHGKGVACVNAPTGQRAICLAALLALSPSRP